MTTGEGHASPSARREGVPRDGTFEHRSGWADAAWLALIAAASFALRWAYFFETAEVPFLRHRVGDAAAYWAWGSRIASGAWLGDEAFYQAPLYPYLLGVWFSLWGECAWVVRGMQSLLTCLGVGVLGWGASRSFGRAVGLLTAGLYGLYAPSLFFDGIVQKESVAAALVCVLFALWSKVPICGTFCRAAAVGVVLGLLALLRENTQLWIPVVAVWVGRMAGGGAGGAAARGASRAMTVALSRAAAVLLGCGLILGPVAVRNRVVGGTWALSTVQSGPNFYIGNSAEADGRYRPLVRGHETPAFERRDATVLAERAEGRPLTAREVSRYWWRRGWSDIAADPSRWVGLMLRKAVMVFHAYEVSDAESLYVYSEFSAILRGLMRVWDFGVLFPLAAVGVWSTRRHWRALCLLYVLVIVFAGSTALFFVLARYRFPMVPLLMPFAAAGILAVFRDVWARRWPRLAGAGLIAALSAVVAHWPVHDRGRLDALARMNLGVALAEAGEVEAAVTYFQKAVAGHPTSAEGHLNLAQALALQGRFAEAVPHYARALASEPGLPGVEYNLGVALEQVGRADEALALYRRAVRKDAADVDAREAVLRLERAGE